MDFDLVDGGEEAWGGGEEFGDLDCRIVRIFDRGLVVGDLLCFLLPLALIESKMGDR